MQMTNKVGGVIKLSMVILLLLAMAITEGCGSGYETHEENGRVYVQRKSWWKKMLFGPY